MYEVDTNRTSSDTPCGCPVLVSCQMGRCRTGHPQGVSLLVPSKRGEKHR